MGKSCILSTTSTNASRDASIQYNVLRDESRTWSLFPGNKVVISFTDPLTRAGLVRYCRRNAHALSSPLVSALASAIWQLVSLSMNPDLSDGEEEELSTRISRRGNNLPIHGSEKTMNLNSMVLTNVLNSVYFKNVLVQLKTYHEIVDEIYNHVSNWLNWISCSGSPWVTAVGCCNGILLLRFITWSRGRREVGNWQDKLACVAG